MFDVKVVNYEVNEETQKRLNDVDELIKNFEVNSNSIDEEVDRIIRLIKKNETEDIEIGGIEDYVYGHFFNSPEDSSLVKKIGLILTRLVELKLSE